MAGETRHVYTSLFRPMHYSVMQRPEADQSPVAARGSTGRRASWAACPDSGELAVDREMQKGDSSPPGFVPARGRRRRRAARLRRGAGRSRLSEAKELNVPAIC